MMKRTCIFAALAVSAFAFLPAQAAQKYPEVKGFKETKVNPPCLAIGTAPHVPESITATPDGKPPEGSQTLWIDNNCSESMVFDSLRHTFSEGAHDANGTQVVFSFRQSDGSRRESGNYLLRYNANGDPCRTTDFLVPVDGTAPQIASCRSLTIAPQESIGFRPFPPLTVEWHGMGGTLVKGVTIQE